MDLIFRTLWPSSQNSDVSIPQYQEGEEEDNIDLKVKALSYLFKRLKIEKLPHFNATHEFTEDNSIPNNEKLDVVYNKNVFIECFVNDDHRILIDWYKNKFRSLMILSSLPENSNIYEKLGRNFRFQILKPDASIEEYTKVLVNSDLFIEHTMPIETKKNVLLKIFDDQKDLKPSFKKIFNKNDRAVIILKYLQKLSESVQIERIYKVSIMKKIEIQAQTITEDPSEESDITALNSPSSQRARNSRSRSPTRKHPNQESSILLQEDFSKKTVRLSQYPLLAPASIPMSSSPTASSISSRSRSLSPAKPHGLKKKASMTLLKMDSTLKEQDSCSDISNKASSLAKEELTAIYQKSENAVFFRVERERKLLTLK